MQEVIFYFDDSGVLHPNAHNRYFIYAGYVFTSRKEAENAKRKYINANKKIKESLGVKDELKASTLKAKHKRSLFNSLREYNSLSLSVDISRLYPYIVHNKKSICRYKDYVLKRIIKNKLNKLITTGEIQSDKDITISVYIDQQLTGTDGYYDLRDSIKEELQHGVSNFDYGVVHRRVFNSNVSVNITYCDSKYNYLIQACDILANRIWTSYIKENNELRKIPNHTMLTFP